MRSEAEEGVPPEGSSVHVGFISGHESIGFGCDGRAPAECVQHRCHNTPDSRFTGIAWDRPRLAGDVK
jgi:hypothetical protein